MAALARAPLLGQKAALSAVQSQVAGAKALLHGANRGLTVDWVCLADGKPVFVRRQSGSDRG
jgi:hypothetical protein